MGMFAVAFDTLKLARKLESAGFPPKQAQDASAAISESFSEWQASINLATREDVQKLEADVQKMETSLRADTQRFIAEAKTDLIKWVIGVGFAQIAMILAVPKMH